VIVTETVVVSPDGRKMTANYSGAGASGKQVAGTAVFDRFTKCRVATSL